MSNSSIYENKWTDLVFENKNKEYGAYQLRQENSKTTITALFSALLLIAAVGSASMLINKFSGHETAEPITTLPDPIVVVKVDPLVKPETKETVAPPAQKQAVTQPITSAQLTNPVVSRTEEAVEEIATNVENVPVVDNATPGDGTVTNAMPGGSTVGETMVEAPATNEPVIAATLDKMPGFPGGMDKFYSYIGNNFRKPELDAERTLKVYVSFVIERDGSITDIVVQKDPGYGMAKEAIRVLKSLKTKWSPGILNGKPVRTAYNLPITIKTELE